MLLDSSAWIEFFEGTQAGRKVAEFLKNEENFTNVVTLAEIINWCLRNNREDKAELYIEGIKKGSRIIDVDELASVVAGKVNYERKKFVKNWGMIDSLILATGQIYNLKILTKDSQFKDLPNAEIL